MLRKQHGILRRVAISSGVVVLLITIYMLWPITDEPQSDIIAYSPTTTAANNSARSAIMIINTGSPGMLTKDHVEQFIGDMLSDRYVMGLPNWLRYWLSRKIIAPLRASSSLAKYSLIWGDSANSPLTMITLGLGRSIEQMSHIPTTLAMRYAGPTPQQALAGLQRYFPNIDSITLLPLFPQYAESSYLTAVEAARAATHEMGINIKVIQPFFDHPHYIRALADKIRNNTQLGFQKLIFSFHSLPMSHVERGRLLGPEYDYEFQCRETARLTARQLGLSHDQYMVVYASAMGRNWLEPDLDKVLKELPQEGCNSVAVVAPGFVIDNLETLYDLNINARNTFMTAAGKQFIFVPCLNEEFAAVAVSIIADAKADSTAGAKADSQQPGLK